MAKVEIKVVVIQVNTPAAISGNDVLPNISPAPESLTHGSASVPAGQMP